MRNKLYLCKFGIHKYIDATKPSGYGIVLDFIYDKLRTLGFELVWKWNPDNDTKFIKSIDGVNVVIYESGIFSEYENIDSIMFWARPKLKICSRCGKVKDNIQKAKQYVDKEIDKLIDHEYNRMIELKKVNEMASMIKDSQK